MSSSRFPDSQVHRFRSVSCLLLCLHVRIVVWTSSSISFNPRFSLKLDNLTLEHFRLLSTRTDTRDNPVYTTKLNVTEVYRTEFLRVLRDIGRGSFNGDTWCTYSLLVLNRIRLLYTPPLSSTTRSMYWYQKVPNKISFLSLFAYPCFNTMSWPPPRRPFPVCGNYILQGFRTIKRFTGFQ